MSRQHRERKKIRHAEIFPAPQNLRKYVPRLMVTASTSR
jgi:hypothetical protein